MKIGFDLDGVFCNFNVGYIQQHIAVTGKNLFLPGDEVNPPVWDYAAYRGYTKEETSAAWERIKASTSFWRDLPMYQENCEALANLFMSDFALSTPVHDLYFITSRVGSTAKTQTEEWFMELGIFPTVLIVGPHQKGNIAKALQLDCYIDDYYPNCQDVVRVSPQTRCYLHTRAYNEKGVIINDAPNVFYTSTTVEERRVASVEQMLRRESLIP